MKSAELESRLALERARRIILLSNARALYIHSSENLKETAAQSVIVLCYANWEGYFNFCVEAYIDFVNAMGSRIVDLNPALLACVIERYIASMRDRHFPVSGRPQFAREVFSHITDTRIQENVKLLQAASNLDFDRLKVSLDALGIEIDDFQKHRNFIKHELVGWRHQVAHGSEPDLSKVDLMEHTKKTEDLLLIVKEKFEDKLRSL